MEKEVGRQWESKRSPIGQAGDGLVRRAAGDMDGVGT
jgi:hypothetical protein